MFEKKIKNVTEANFNLQLDKVMVQNSFQPIYKISFQVFEFLLNLLQFSEIPIQNNGKLIKQGQLLLLNF